MNKWYMGVMKSALKKILGKRHISLSTLETEIKAALNDRPLILVPSELGDLEPLTTTNLLHGG